MPDDFLLKNYLVVHAKEVEGMLEMDYDEEDIHELFKEDGREEERTNTERGRKRADEVEVKVKELEAKLAAMG